MKIIKKAAGKQTIKMSRKEWKSIGKKAGWMRTAASCPACGDKLSRPMEDEWAECSCGWGELSSEKCESCERFFSEDDMVENVCKGCAEEEKAK